MVDRVAHQILVDNVGNYQYIGRAPSGSETSEAKWSIVRHEYINNVYISSTWVDGNEEYDNVWDDRLTGVYS